MNLFLFLFTETPKKNLLSKNLIIPTYLPSIALAAVMSQADHLVLEVCDNYQKQSYRNRTYINTANGSLTLSIPVKHNSGSGHKKTADAMIENSFLWQRQHWRSIQIAYRSSPFFEFYEDELLQLFDVKYKKLTDFNISGIKILMEMIGITTAISTSTSYEKNSVLDDYRDWAMAKNERVPIHIPTYNQVFNDKHDFNPKVTVLDVLFNLGPQTKDYLQSIEL